MPARRLPPGTINKRKRRKGLALGKALKEEGMERAASGPEREAFLEWARDLAYGIAMKHPRFEVFCDDVRWAIERSGYDIDPDIISPGTWGSIYRCYLFEKTEKRKLSAHPANHGHEYSVWRLKEEYREIHS